MHGNRYWIALLLVVGFCTVYFGYKSLQSLETYGTLSARTLTSTTEWAIQEGRRGKLIPYVRYTFSVAGKRYQGQSAMPQYKFLGRSASDTVLKELSGKRHLVWYNPSHPHSNTLQKSLPLKECLSAITLLGVFVYLMYIGYSVGQDRK